MAYTPNPTWTSSTPLSTTCFNNLETQYDESAAYLASHNHDGLYQTKSEMEAVYWYSGNTGPGTGSDADMIYHADGNMHISSFYGLGVPTGIIILWYGASGAIPSGWALCNGSGGTVDLRGRFVVGAGNTYNPATYGGSATFTVAGTVTVNAHVLTTAEMASHVHPFTDTTPSQGAYPNVSSPISPINIIGANVANSGTTSATGSGTGHGHSSVEGTSFSGNAVASLPFYYALCYIQKI